MSEEITQFPIIEDINIIELKPTGFAKAFIGDLYSSEGRFGNGINFLEFNADNMKSSNFVSGSSGWQILYNGDVEFNDGTFRGSLEASSIHIPSITAVDSFHTDSNGNSWWGAASQGDATASILNTGVASFSNALIIGSSDMIIDTIDTSAKKILSDFNFGTTDYSGALKAGDITWNTTTGAITGGSGIAIYRKGIVGASAGVTTFSIDATTGDATFAGAFSAATGTLGTITTGLITLDTTGYLRGGQTAYDTGTGFFLGYSTDAYKFSIGNPAGENMTWDGSALKIEGDIIVSGNIGEGEVSEGNLANTAVVFTTKSFDKGVINDFSDFLTSVSGSGTIENEIRANLVATGNTQNSVAKVYQKVYQSPGVWYPNQDLRFGITYYLTPEWASDVTVGAEIYIKYGMGLDADTGSATDKCIGLKLEDIADDTIRVTGFARDLTNLETVVLASDLTLDNQYSFEIRKTGSLIEFFIEGVKEGDVTLSMSGTVNTPYLTHVAKNPVSGSKGSGAIGQVSYYFPWPV